jgi:hypothetical protein
MAKKRKKLSLNQAVEKLTAIAEKHLASLPEEERDARVSALARRTFTKRRGSGAISAAKRGTRKNPVAARGR